MMPPGITRIGATLEIELLRDGNNSDEDDDLNVAADGEILVEVILQLSPPAHVTDPISDQLMLTVLPTIALNEDRWAGSAVYGKDGKLFHTVVLSVAEVERLLFAVEVEGEFKDGIPEAQPSSRAHYVSAAAIVDSVVNGSPMRSACSVWLVSRQDPDGLEVCEKCIEQLPDASMVREILRRRILDD